MSLYILPDEILLILFNYCNAHDLFQLSGVCKRFYNIASEVLTKKSNNLLVTGQKSEKFCERCQPLLSSYKEKFPVCYNWKIGRYESKLFDPKLKYLLQCDNEETFLHGLQMTKDVILFSMYKEPAKTLCAFNRTKNGSVSDDNMIVEECYSQILDIFVPRNDIIVTYHRDRSIQQWTIKSLDGRKYFNKKLLLSPSSNPYIKYHYMDVTPQSIIICANTGEIEIWKYTPEENSIKDKYIISNLNLNRTLKSDIHFITFDPTETKFAAGISYGRNHAGRFIIYDINKCCTEIDIRAKDLDLNLWNEVQTFWKDPNDIFHVMDDDIIKIDARTHKVVQKWNAPFEKKRYYIERITCMSTDNQYAIMTGTYRGKVILWDQRQSKFIQVYDKENVGYVRDLQFDSSRMYVSADYGIYEFDFTKI